MTLLLLVGCVTYEEGRAAEGEAACRLREACGQLADVGYDDVDACITAATHQDWVACDDYSAERMQGCLDAWEAAVSAEDCAVLADPPDLCAAVCAG